METAAHGFEPETTVHPFNITVNEKPVPVLEHHLTGLEIKQAAIDHGVPIQLDFVLTIELEHGQGKVVGDADRVAVNRHSRFIAVAPDDNS